MILLDHVTKTYPGDEEPALDNVSLHIEPHEFVFLVGKSGAGKSTLIKMITKEEHPDSGKIVVGGIDLDYVRRRHIPHYRRRLGVVFQDYKLLPTRTVFENVAFALEIAGMSNREIQKTVPKVLDLVGLENKSHKFPQQLSGGERQRVSIARSVARQPKILIADEPTGNLDVLTRHEIIDLLQKINDFGTTLLVTTHDENIVNNLSKRVITLKAGRIIEDQKYHGIYRLEEEPEETIIPTEKIVIPQPIIEKIQAQRPARNPKAPLYSMKIDHSKSSRTTAKSPTAKTPRVSESKTKTKTTTNAVPPPVKSATAPAKAPTQPTKKYARDSANQWYAASKPLRSAPKLSKLNAGQTIKLKPAPSLKQVVKKQTEAISRSKQKRVI